MSPEMITAARQTSYTNSYKIDGEYHGTRVYYGLKPKGDDSYQLVGVYLPVNKNGKTPEEIEEKHKIIFVDIKTHFGDPCPPYCDNTD